MFHYSLVSAFLLTFCVCEYAALNIKLNDITDCNISKSQLQKNFVLSTNLIKNGKNAYLQASATLPSDIDKSYNYTLYMLKWEKNKWMPKGAKSAGHLCEAMARYGQRLWRKISDVSQPKISSQCPLKAGIYSIDHFVATKADIDIPADFLGHYLLHLEISKGGIPIICKLFDVEGRAA